MVLSIYIKELLYRLWYSFISVLLMFTLLFLYRNEIILSIVVNYLVELHNTFQYTDVLEIFLIQLKLNVYISVLLFFLLFYVNLILFLINGLYKEELKRFVVKQVKFISYLFSSIIED